MVQHFENSTIHGRSFLHVNENHHYSVGSSQFWYNEHLPSKNRCWTPEIQTLNNFISHGTLQDLAAWDPPPRCFPGTHKKEKEAIIHWIDDLNLSSSVFIVQGCTGVRKTALIQSIADQLQAENWHSYACFFFQWGMVGWDSMGQLFSTLTYQLATNTVTSIWEHVEQVMMIDPALPTKSIATQLQSSLSIPSNSSQHLLLLQYSSLRDLTNVKTSFRTLSLCLFWKSCWILLLKFDSSFQGSWTINIKACAAMILFWVGLF